MKQEFNKLVRDNLPEILSKDQTVKTYCVTFANYPDVHGNVRNKLIEELDEVLCSYSTQEITTELADLLEVMEKYAEINGIQWDDVLVAQQIKAAKVGKFEKNTILKSITYNEPEPTICPECQNNRNYRTYDPNLNKILCPKCFKNE